MIATYRNSKKERVQLDVKLGDGGEGEVYAVAGNAKQAAKIWRPSNPANISIRFKKVRIMMQNRPVVLNGGGSLFIRQHTPFAWPEDVLYDNGEGVGFLMPKIDTGSFREIFRYYHPLEQKELELERNAEYERQDFLLMARNLAETVGWIHQAGYVIGDINEKNVLANDQAQVVIIDCDSMQVENSDTNETYLCTVGRPEYMPPWSALGAKRTANDDRFGLAVFIFKLMMRGLHPYQISSTRPETKDKIKLGHFPYRDNNSRSPRISETTRQFKENWQSMEPNLRRCFREAFAPDYKSMRPSPDEWVDELDYIINPSSTGNSRQTERRLQDAKQQLQDSEQKRQSAERRLQEVDRQLQDSEQKRQSAERRLQEVDRQLQDSEQKRQSAERRLQEVDRQLKSADHERTNAGQQREYERLARNQAGQRLEEMARQLVGEQQERVNAEQRLADAQLGRTNAEQQLATAEQRLADAQQQLTDEKQRRVTTEQRLESERQNWRKREKLVRWTTDLIAFFAGAGVAITTILFVIWVWQL